MTALKLTGAVPRFSNPRFIFVGRIEFLTGAMIIDGKPLLLSKSEFATTIPCAFIQVIPILSVDSAQWTNIEVVIHVIRIELADCMVQTIRILPFLSHRVRVSNREKPVF